MKHITRKVLQVILEETGHHLNASIPILEDKVRIVYKTILNNAVVINPYSGEQDKYFNTNKVNADKAMKFVKDEIKLYSSVFQEVNGDYNVVE